MSRSLFKSLAIVVVLLAGTSAFGQATDKAQTPSNRSQVVGVVTSIDNAPGRITIKNDAGETISINAASSATILRLPPGETSAQKAISIALTDIAVGERLFARGTLATDQKTMDARQVVVSGGGTTAATSSDQERQREEFRQRGLMGRITALSPDKKEIMVQSRGRDSAGVTVLSSDTTRFFRYAPDSMDIKHASRSSFAGLRVGDQIRALGNRSTDGAQFTAEEIITGSTTRVAGQVTSVDAAKNEFTVKNGQGQTFTVAIGPHSSLRRVTPEAAASFEANRQPRADRARRRDEAQPREGGQDGRPRERRERGAGGEGRWRGGRGFQDMLQNLPSIAVSDLKKGDTVVITGSEGADASHLTAIMLITGDQAFMTRFMQNGPNRGPQNPGLPGDVMGGGVGPAERPVP